MFWTREIAGWTLIILGLVGFGLSYVFLLNRRVFEAGALSFGSFIVFRGGLHLVKVAVAARICQQTMESRRPETLR